MLIAPSEPPRLCAAGHVTPVTESYGVDVLWSATAIGLVGVQRKVFPGDFLASVDDGRLAKEFAQMQALDVAVLVLEGRATWTTDGVLLTTWGKTWTRSAHRRYLLSVRARGVWVEWTDSLDDTLGFLVDLQEWSRKERHDATTAQPKPRGDAWGRVTSRDYKLAVLQQLPTVGPALAERIHDGIGFPFALTATEADFQKVRGIGRTRARRIVRAFTNGDGT